jgi:osmoprotectant transport system permease protein
VILGRSLGGSHDATLTALPGVDTTSDCYNFVNNSWFCPAYFVDRSDEIVSALQEHVLLTVVSVLLGTLLAFPLAVLARRSDLAAAVVLGISTIIYTIPSLAMFSLLLVVFYVFNLSGITRTNVVIGLALYSLTILVRNMLFRIELPLALPVIFAGLRVATVSTVALVTVGSILGYGGLGNLIREGYNTNFKAELFTGSVLCVLLAVAFDLLLLGVQRVSTPWQRR